MPSGDQQSPSVDRIHYPDPQPPNPPSSNGSGTDTEAILHELRQNNKLLSVIDGRAQFAKQVGISFGGDRDLYRQLGFPNRIPFEEYRARYERGDIAEVLIELFPSRTWSNSIVVSGVEDNSASEAWDKSLVELWKRLSMWTRIVQADILAGIGHYAVLVIGSDNGDVKEPLKVTGPDGILFLKPYAQEQAEIIRLEEDPNNERFGLPTVYNLTTIQDEQVTSAQITKAIPDLKVHWSRVIHFAEGALDNPLIGKPRLKSVWNLLILLDRLVGSGAEAAWKRQDAGLHANLDKDMNPADGELDKFQKEFDKYRHRIGRLIKTRGMTIDVLDGEVFDFGDNQIALITQIAASKQIPLPILIGQLLGDRSSTQNRIAFNKAVNRRQDTFGETVLRSIVDRFISVGALDEIDYRINWPAIDDMGADEKAIAAKDLALANKAQVESGDGIIVSNVEIRKDLGGYVDVDAEELERTPPAKAGSVSVEQLNARVTTLESFDNVEDVSGKDQEPEWRVIHRVADEHVGSLENAFIEYWNDIREGVDRSELINALTGFAAGVISEANALIALEPVNVSMSSVSGEFLDIDSEVPRDNSLPDRYLSILKDGGEAAVRSARNRGSWYVDDRAANLERKLASIGLSNRDIKESTAQGHVPILSNIELLVHIGSFDTTSQRAIDLSTNSAIELVEGLTVETNAGLLVTLRSGLEQGLSTTDLSTRLIDSIGLTEARSQSVAVFASELASASAGDVVTAGEFSVKIPTAGVTAEFADRSVDRLIDRLLRQRANLISRTVTITAANEGQLEAWNQAVDIGDLPSNQQRIWINTRDDRLRDKCASVGGQVRGLDELFQYSDGELTNVPSLPNERCGIGLVNPNV